MTVFVEIVQAQNTLFLSPLENEILAELNYARQNPKAYSDKLLERLTKFNGYLYYSTPNSIPLKTAEGVAAVEEAIEFLNSQKPLPPFMVSQGMSKGARLLVEDQSASGQFGHIGSDNSDSSSRVSQFGDWDITLGENVSYGAASAEDIVAGYIIDDKAPTRGHRTNIFNPNFRVIGVAFGAHKSELRTMTVIDFAGDYTEK